MQDIQDKNESAQEQVGGTLARLGGGDAAVCGASTGMLSVKGPTGWLKIPI